MKRQSRFITLEGGEGAGKSTLMKKLAEHIPNAITTFEPGDTRLGKSIRDLLLNKDHMTPRAELLLFLADRAQHVEEVILPALSEGKTVICDRFTDSSIAYQGAARALDTEEVCAFATNNLEPDLTFYLDIDPAIGLTRTTTSDRLENEALDFHTRVREGFLCLAKKYPRIKILDATKTPDEVFLEACAFL